jgi:transglutaminase-like putative cysteine protease
VPTPFINADHPAIRAWVEGMGVLDKPVADRARRLFHFVRDDIAYEFLAKWRREEYVASYILEKGKGFCTQKAVLLCALGRAAGIPTALVLADLRDHSLPRRVVAALGTDMLVYHGFVAFHLEGRWRKADPTLSPDVVKRGRYRPVEFDGHGDALLAPTTLDGGPHAEYVTIRGAFADLPFDEMVRSFSALYAEADFRVLLEQARKRRS